MSALKGHAVNRVVLLEPVVRRVAPEGLRDLVAGAQDDVLLVASRLVAGLDHCLLHTWADAVRHVAHTPPWRIRSRPVAQLMSTGAVAPCGTSRPSSSHASFKACCRAACAACAAFRATCATDSAPSLRACSRARRRNMAGGRMLPSSWFILLIASLMRAMP